MLRFAPKILVVLTVSVLLAGRAEASPVTVPFTENFATDSAQWKSGASTDVTYVSSGGPGGAGDGYISTVFTETSTTSAVAIFRGQDNFNSSAGAFIGDWATAGVTEYSFWIRQNSTASLTLGTRFTTSANFPAFSALTSTLIPPNEWTKVTFAISPTSSDLQPEGPTAFTDVFGNIARLQILAARGSLGVGTQVTFDLDRVSIVPEPATFVSTAGGGLLLATCLASLRKRRKKSA